MPFYVLFLIEAQREGRSLALSTPNSYRMLLHTIWLISTYSILIKKINKYSRMITFSLYGTAYQSKMSLILSFTNPREISKYFAHFHVMVPYYIFKNQQVNNQEFKTLFSVNDMSSDMCSGICLHCCF